VRKLAFLFLLGLLLTNGCGSGDKPRFSKEELANIRFPERSNPSEHSGGFVLVVGGEAISAEEIVFSLMGDLRAVARSSTFEQFKEQAREQVEQAVTTVVLNILLYREAKRESGEDVDEALEKLAETELRRFVARFEGDEAKAEEALEQMGMSRQSYKEYVKMTVLVQSYRASKMPENIPITYSELLQRYNEMKDEFFASQATIKFELLDIEVAALEVTDPNQDLGPEDRQKFARELANELSRRIGAGEDFDRLAEEYSGVSLRVYKEPVRPESLVEPYNTCAVEAEKMKPGEVSAPIETGGRIFIIKLEEKQAKGYKPLEEVQKQVEEKIIAERRQEAEDALEAELLRQAALSEKEAFIDFCLKEIYRLSNEQNSKD
jgi:parvulin-like peptidyl-prolyl isomerase